MNCYPITAQKILPKIPNRLLRKKVRQSDEILIANAHEVLVYRVAGKLIFDYAALPPDHEIVVNASHVSSVDMSVNQPIAVDAALTTADLAIITLRATFLCTVTDPVMVVRNGCLDVRSKLGHYLSTQHTIRELAAQYPVDEITRRNNNLNATIKTFIEDHAPVEPGIHLQMTSAQIFPPEEITNFAKQRRELHRSSIFSDETDTYEHIRTLRTQDNHYEQKSQRQRLEFDLTDESRRREWKLAEDRGSFELAIVQQLAEKIGERPSNALYLALVRGGLDPVEFTERLHSYLDHLDQRRREDDYRQRSENIEILERHMDVMKELIKRGEADNVNIDPDKLDLLFNKLVEDVSNAVDVLPIKQIDTPEAPSYEPFEHANQ